jgi:hypothetical protein
MQDGRDSSRGQFCWRLSASLARDRLGAVTSGFWLLSAHEPFWPSLVGAGLPEHLAAMPLLYSGMLCSVGMPEYNMQCCHSVASCRDGYAVL